MTPVRPATIQSMRALVCEIATEEAFAAEVARFAAKAEAIGETATAESMRQIARTRRVAGLEKRGRLAALLAASEIGLPEA